MRTGLAKALQATAPTLEARVWLVAAVICSLSVITVLGKASEDVFARDGWELTDLSEVRAIASHRNPVLVHAANIDSDLASVGALLIAAVLAGLWLWWIGERLFVALGPLVALCASGFVAGCIKLATDRPRPPAALQLVSESDASFPSAHTSDVTAFLLTFVIVLAVALGVGPGRKVLLVVGALIAAASVGLSRLLLGVHFPTDVIAGWSIGFLVAVVVTSLVLIARQRASAPPPVTSQQLVPVRLRWLMRARTSRSAFVASA